MSLDNGYSFETCVGYMLGIFSLNPQISPTKKHIHVYESNPDLKEDREFLKNLFCKY